MMELAETFAFHKVFSSHMVLQRDRKVVLSGTAPGKATARIIDADRTFEKIRLNRKMTLPPQSVLLVEWNTQQFKQIPPLE